MASTKEARWYSTGEVGRMFGVAPQTVNRWIAAGRFPNARAWGRHRISQADLDAALAANRAASENADAINPSAAIDTNIKNGEG